MLEPIFDAVQPILGKRGHPRRRPKKRHADKAPVALYLTGSHGGLMAARHIASFVAASGMAQTLSVYYILSGQPLEEKDVVLPKGQKVQEKDRVLQPDRVIDANSQCPDLQLSPDSPAYFIPQSFAWAQENPNQPCRILNCNMFGLPKLFLSEILQMLPGNHFVWACCQEFTHRKTKVKKADDPEELSELEKVLEERRKKVDESALANFPNQNDLDRLDAEHDKQKPAVPKEQKDRTPEQVAALEAWRREDSLIREVYAAVSCVQPLVENFRTRDQLSPMTDKADDKKALESRRSGAPVNFGNRLTAIAKLKEDLLHAAAKLPAFRRYNGIASMKSTIIEHYLAMASPEVLAMDAHYKMLKAQIDAAEQAIKDHEKTMAGLKNEEQKGAQALLQEKRRYLNILLDAKATAKTKRS